MSLAQAGAFNDFSPKFREELEARVRGFGKQVRYRFNIAKPNPDPTKHDGETIYPNQFTLDPTRFNIMDKHEDRPNKQKNKLVALVTEVDNDGKPTRFKKIRVFGRDRAILRLDLEKDEDFQVAMAMELHPRLSGGQFQDKNSFPLVSRIDEMKAATEARQERTERLKAQNVAQAMSDKEVIDFADAMLWDSTQEPEILRNQVEELADLQPVYFNDLVKSKAIEYQSVIKQAKDRGLISFDPAENRWFYTGNNQVIAILSPNGEKNEYEKLSDVFQSGGAKMEESYKKIKSLLK